MPEPRKITVNGEQIDLIVLETGRDKSRFRIGERVYEVALELAATQSSPHPVLKSKKSQPLSNAVNLTGDEISVCSPIPGVITEVLCEVGKVVETGDLLLKIEAMKMQNNIFAPGAGTIKDVLVSLSQEVSDSQLLVVIQRNIKS
jgi:biotin carboxyl carrier protein